MSSSAPPPAEAVIIAGGLGTRLLPLTTHRPKHLLEVGGVPFLFHQLARLADAGVGHVVLATSYRAEHFEPVLGDGSRWGLRLEYVCEHEPLGTAGALRNAAAGLDDDPDRAVVVLNGDILSGHDLGEQLRGFATGRYGSPVDVSLHLVEVPDARAFGSVPTDARGRVTAFTEKSDSPVSRQVNAGCYVFRRGVVDEIPPGRVVSVERETFPALLGRGRVVVGHVDSAYWRDVGTPEALVAASRDVVTGAAPSAAIGPAPSGARVDGSAVVAPSATVDEGSCVAARCRVGSAAHVSGSVVMHGAEIGEGARLVGCLVGPGVVVGAHARLTGAALGDGARVCAGTTLPEGHRVACGETVRSG